MQNQDYDKIRRNIRQWMLGKEYHAALAAMEIGLTHHTGLRKDGVTPEFQHQVSQATFCRSLDSQLLFPEETLATIFLHDIVEDCDITMPELLLTLEYRGVDDAMLERIHEGVTRMTNQYGDGFVNGEKSPKKPYGEYYGEMIECPISSICKGMDRMHNHQSMHRVFSNEKMRDYIDHTRTYIIPMLKDARKKWSRQEAAYTNVKHILETQTEWVEAILDESTQR